MSSLTPGTLSSLLQNLHTPTTTTSTSHRLPILQVIAILPSLTFSDPLKTNAFYLRVSDFLHSAYVSLPDNETELILSDKIQLGQFIYLNRLDSGSPVPVIRGIKVVKKRRGVCVGEPKDLIGREVLLNDNKSKGKGKRENVKKSLSLRRVSLGNDGNEGLERRRFSLDWAARRGWDRSPVARNGGPRGSFDSASKCEGDSEIASLLGQLKRVNQWLDNSFPEENGTNERIEGLKKKIYGYLLDNVDSAIISR